MGEWETFGAEVQERTGRPGTRCHVGLLLKVLDDEGREAVKGALNNGNLSASAIAKALAGRLGEGAPKQHSISAHRRGDCRCVKEGS